MKQREEEEEESVLFVYIWIWQKWVLFASPYSCGFWFFCFFMEGMRKVKFKTVKELYCLETEVKFWIFFFFWINLMVLVMTLLYLCLIRNGHGGFFAVDEKWMVFTLFPFWVFCLIESLILFSFLLFIGIYMFSG